MIVGITGPSKLNKTKALEKAAKEVVSALIKSNSSIILSPDKKSTQELVAKEYKRQNGKKIIGIDYADDTYGGYLGLNRSLCDKLIDVKTWENQPKELIKKSDCLIVFGLSVGVIWELCLTKFYGKHKIFVIIDVVKDKLPSYIAKDINVKYIKAKDISKFIN